LRFDRATATEVLASSFAEWQARAAAQASGRGRDGLVEQLGRRLAVLQELGYVDGWRCSDAGRCLSRIYHEADLLVAEAIAGGALDGAEPSVLAGVLSAAVFERRRARRTPGHEARRPTRRQRGGGDRLGERRRTELSERLSGLVHHAERVRAVEEVHLVPRTRQPEPGLAGAVAAWARGAGFGTVLEVAARDVGEIAPGDFVRTVKQVADLADQVAQVSEEPATAEAAAEAVERLLRGVVASTAAGTTPP